MEPNDLATPPPPELVNDVSERILGQLRKVIVGQDRIIHLLLTSMFCRGHCLLIGVPGLAKTLLVKSLAQALSVDFKRIQFTPDLMPSDILGSEVINRDDATGSIQIQFQYGPIFTNLLLADEINRTPPKTQSALLEAMQERRVTLMGQDYALPDPFIVVATQNPIEHEGTYPLPEAQLDRFMFSLNLEYPEQEEEIDIVTRTTRNEVPTLEPNVTGDEVLAVQQLVRSVPVSEHVVRYAVSLAVATRPSATGASEVAREYLEWGAGPRASQSLVLAAKALALIRGKPAPEATDIREVAVPVLQHRVVPNYRATGAGKGATSLIEEILRTVREPDYLE